MNSQANELETAALSALAAQEPLLLPSISMLRVCSRKLTGAGSYTDFSPVSPVEVPDGHVALQQDIQVPGVPGGLGAVLFISAGVPSCLELYTYGIDERDVTFSGFAVGPSA